MNTRLLSRALVGAALLVGSPSFAAPIPDEAVFPPWQHGRNNDAADRGLEFTVPEADDMADFHGQLEGAELVLYVGGNYFFAMAPLVQAFETEHPEYKGRLFWETIPPGLLAQQLKRGGRITVGNMTFVAKPDVYLAGLKKVRELVSEGALKEPVVPYVTNTLTIMVPKDNPGHITALSDLGRKNVRLAMPNPAFEGIARQIKLSLAKAGGEALVAQVYEAKVQDGSAMLTHIHHRQTPLFLMLGHADAGVTWQSEAIFQEQAGHPITHVDIPAADNTQAIYAGAEAAAAPHPEPAHAWLSFIRSDKALEIFKSYGFKPYDGSH